MDSLSIFIGDVVWLLTIDITPLEFGQQLDYAIFNCSH